MNAKDVARGGMLAAGAVALLYIGGVSPWMGIACCAAAGVFSAVPLLRRGKVRHAVLLYLAAALLSALIVPRKSVAAGYIGLFGVYPILKYGIESRIPRHVQRYVKLAYFNVLLAVLAVLAKAGLFPQFAGMGFIRLALIWFAANIAFEFYDVGLSRLIAALRRRLPPD